MLKQKKFLIGGVIIVIAVVFLAYTGFQSSSAYYYTVNEVLEQGSTLYGENLRVNGTVDGDSIVSDIDTLNLSFTLTEGTGSIPVKYRGVTPDNFNGDVEVVVGGVMDSSGVLQADSITTKCPSKYVPQE